MYLSRLRLAVRSREALRDVGDCQQMHRTLMSAFPDVEVESARQEHAVLYRLDLSPDGAPVVLVQSRVAPRWESLPTGYASSAETVSLDPLLDRMEPGSTALFRLLANPTRKIDTKSGPDGVRRNGRRVDLRTDDERLAWLERKAALAGAELRRASGALDARVAGEQRVVGYRGASRPRSRVTLAGVLFEGTVRIVDPARLRQAVGAGIGSGKAYGFGLLSLALLDAH